MILRASGPEEVLALLRADLPELEIREIRAIQDGRENWVFEVDGKWIFRFPRHEWTAFDYELGLLRHLQGRMSLCTPSIEFVGRQPRYLGYRKLGGRILGSDLVAGRTADIAKLAEFLCDLHAIDIEAVSRLGVPRRPYVKPEEELGAHLTRLCGDQGWLPFALRCLERLLDSHRDETWEGVLHHDLHGDNVVLSEGGTIVGVIDFGDACIGDIHRDFKGICWHGFDSMLVLVDSYEALSGRRLDRKRIKDIFCVTNLWEIVEFSSRERNSAETALLARSERWLAEWAEIESQGRW